MQGTRGLNSGTRNSETLADFAAYCRTHPNERFWQALRNWSGAVFIGYWRRDTEEITSAYLDTFYWEGRAK